VGEASSIIQDDEQLREAIFNLLGKSSGFSGLADEWYILHQEQTDELLALFQKGQQSNYELGKDVVLEMLGNGKYKVYANPEHIRAAQLQLVNELEGHKKRYVTELAWKHAASEEAVPLSVLKHKKQELEGKPQSIKRTGTMDVITKDEVKKFRDYDER
jgi:hypothetical protein